MKIGILTLHRANNYGAVLQCFALQETLKSLGHDTWVIDYRQKDTELSYKAFSLTKIKSSSKNIKLFIKAILYIPYTIIQQLGFNHFRHRYLKCTAPVNKAADIPQDFDVYIIGSDQLWSLQCMRGNLDPIFWGQFPHRRTSKIIGYAISSNITSLKKIGINRLNQLLTSFRTISLREEEICNWIISNTNFKVRQDIDPTLLYKYEDWNKFIAKKRPRKKRYVLMYFLLPEQKVQAKEFANRLGLHLIEVGKVAFSPEKFLTYVKYADYIIGGSFHIAVFSIIFNKRFYIIKKNNEFDVRSSNLLNSIGLSNHFIQISDLSSISKSEIEAKPNYDMIKEKINQLKQLSLEYLMSI